MPFPCDLAEYPWIPVRELEGPAAFGEVGLADALAWAHEHTLAATGGPEHTTLMRLLTVLAARITGLDTYGPDQHQAWLQERNRLLSQGRFDIDAVDAYVDAHRPGLDLFDPERPWMQDARLAQQCPKSVGVNGLVPERPSGNNLVWFAHFSSTDQVPLAPGEAARTLLRVLAFGPAGLGATRVVEGHRSHTVTAGPLRSTLSYHPEGRTLFESLLLGMPFVARTGPDTAPWESPDQPDPLAPVPAPTGIATLVLGQYRHAVLLVPAPEGAQVVDAYLTWATAAKERTPVRDPWMIHRTKPTGEAYPLQADTGRGLWRDVDALLTDRANGEGEQPAVWRDLAHCARVQRLDHVHVRSAGIDQDRQTRDRSAIWELSPHPIGGFLPPARRLGDASAQR